MKLSLNQFFLFGIFYTGSLFTSEQSTTTIHQLPPESLSIILAYAYAHYDEPVEFTRIRLVSKQWDALTQSEQFTPLAEQKGFIKPVMIFYCINIYQRNDPNILKQDITSDKNTAEFIYWSYNTIIPDSQSKEIFWRGKGTYLAIWVNPTKTIVYNNMLNKQSEKEQSLMPLQSYITHVAKKDITQPKHKDNHIICDPITAEPLEITNKKYFSKDHLYHARQYNMPVIKIATPISAQRFVKKWPTILQFKNLSNL